MKRNLPVILFVVYVVLLLFQVPVAHSEKLLLADCVFPFLGMSLLPYWKKALDLFRNEKGLWLLLGFLCLAGISSAYHGSYYDIAVFFYMATLYVTMRLVEPSDTLCMRLGSFMLAVIFIFYCVALVWRWQSGDCSCAAGGLFYVDQYLHPENHSVLGARYQFLFDNPNLLGTFFIFPIALCSEYTRKNLCPKITSVPRLIFAIVVTFILLLPLVSTVSKHAVASLAMVAVLYCQMPILKTFKPAFFAWAGITLFGVAALVSTTFRCSPLRAEFPYINTNLPANYAIHRAIYAKICVHSWSGALLGHSPTELETLYPSFADRSMIAATMESYGTPELTDRFCTFMDPHIEYLNLAAFFGFPAMLCCILFWLSHLAARPNAPAWPKLVMLGILLCCCWDDAMSKRWFWVSAARYR